MNNYTILHLHSMDSNPFSGLTVDSITPYEQYIYKAKELGMKAIAFTEHGSVLHNIAKKQLCEKNGIKYIHAEEFYVTKSLDNLERDNYHCLLYAANKEGVRELNYLSSISMNKDDGHFYYNPRITIDELINTSDNIFILTGCVAGMLAKGDEEIQEKFLKFVIANKHRCWLEIQPHKFHLQVMYNNYLCNISQKYGLKLIATSDIHAINEEHMDGRAMMQKSKNIVFHDEDECDLTFKSYDQLVDAFNWQGSLPTEVFMNAIEETNRFADMVEDYDLDYSNKYPRLYDNAEKEFKKRIIAGIYERGINKLPNYRTEYKPRIKEEFKAYKQTDAIDFMLLDSDYKNWMRENGMHCGCSRGSVAGSLIAYLIHSTDVDSVKYNLNFSRFINPERASLADVDTDIFAEDRYKVREYFFNKPGLYCCNIVTFNTIQLKGAIKDIGRALGMTPDETQAISNQVYADENGNDTLPKETRDKYPELIKYVDIVNGTITSLGRHAAGIVCSPTDVRYDFGTLSISSDPRPVSQIDMHEVDSLNFVKLDLLGLNAVGLIDKACKLIGIDYLTPDKMDFSDENVINSIAKDTTLIFQFESGFASDGLKSTLSKKSINNMKSKNNDISYLDIIAMVSGAIRPAGESYREDLFHGRYHDNGDDTLNKFLEPTLGYLVYQCQIIEFLNKFCGFTMGQADIVRRGFAKKTGTDEFIPVIKNGGYMKDIHGDKDERYIKGFVTIAQEQYGMTKEKAEEVIVSFLQVIEDASSYLFSKNHAVPYSQIGFMIGWLRYYYPVQLLTAALNVYKANDAKMLEIKEYTKSKGIKIEGIKFGKSKAEYFMDVNSNTIYTGIESIKNCNAKMAEDLYELSFNKYDNFLKLLIDIKEKKIVQSNQLEILIKLDYFSDFGDINYLLKIVELYDKIYSKCQFKKDKLEELEIPEYIIKKYSAKETPKMYYGVDTIALLNEMISKIKAKKTTLLDKLNYQKEYLGYVSEIRSNLDNDYYYIEEISGNWLTLYQLNSGDTLKVKARKNTLTLNGVCTKQIIKVGEIREERKWRKVNDEWVRIDKTEPVVTSFKILK